MIWPGQIILCGWSFSWIIKTPFGHIENKTHFGLSYSLLGSLHLLNLLEGVPYESRLVTEDRARDEEQRNHERQREPVDPVLSARGRESNEEQEHKKQSERASGSSHG